jgi:inhibitor of KinA sporulation pathway (predicted exonuclease)
MTYKSHTPKNFLSLDLELNHDDHGRTAEIIQVGYVIGNPFTGEVCEQIRKYVKNQHTRSIAPFITELTGITDDDINKYGVTLTEILAEVNELVAKYDIFVNPVTWGGGDSVELRNAALSENPDVFKNTRWAFGRRWIDVKTLYIVDSFATKRNYQGGLKKSCNRLGITFDGPAHDALQDALNTFKVFSYYVQRAPQNE